MKMPKYLPLALVLGLTMAAHAQQWDAAPAYGVRPVPSPLAQNQPKAWVQKVYPVADLIIPIDQASQPACALTGCAVPESFHQPGACAVKLMKLVTAVHPDSWKENGGSGRVEYYPNGHALVVFQTAEVQERVGVMLESLRKLQDVNVVLEMRFVRVNPELCEKLGLAVPMPNAPVWIRQTDEMGRERVGVEFNEPTPMPAKTCVWNEKQVWSFLDAVQNDCRSNVMQAPKMTLFNGQVARVQVGQTQHFVTGMKVEECKGRKLCIPINEPVFIGTHCEVQAVAKPDCREIMLRFKAKLSEECGPAQMKPVVTMVMPEMPAPARAHPVPFTQYIQKPCVQTIAADCTATVPTNATLVVPAGTFVRETRWESTSPVLNKVPYVSRLFKNVGYARMPEHVVVLVTPRVIRHSAEAVRANQPGCCLMGTGCNSDSGVVGRVCAQVCPVPCLPGAGQALRFEPVKAPCCETKANGMNLADVVALSESSVSDDVIINQIHTTRAKFTLSTEDILWLKKNKVSDKVVMEMQNSRPAPSMQPTAPRVVSMPMPMPMPAPAYAPFPSAPAQWAPPPMPPAPTPYLQPVNRTTPSPMPYILPSSQFTPAPPVPSQSLKAVPTPISAGVIGEHMLGATAWLVDGIACFVGEDLPEVFGEVGGAQTSVRTRVEALPQNLQAENQPKKKLTVEFKIVK